MLSWQTTLVLILYPCASRNWCVRRTSLTLSKRPMSSLLQELLEGIFYLVDELVVAPWPNVRMEQVCPLKSLWRWWEASTYQTILESDSADKVRCKNCVDNKYFKTRLTLPKSSALGCLTCVVIKATVVWKEKLGSSFVPQVGIWLLTVGILGKDYHLLG